MNSKKPGRGMVKRHIQDADKVFVAPDCSYVPSTEDHKRLWPKICTIIGERGAWYSTLRAASAPNKDYIAYLIGDLGALVSPELDKRLGQTRS